MTARAAKLKVEGKDVVGLAAGEPDFDTLQYIKDAAITAISAGTKYTPVGGIPPLREAIVRKFKRDNGLDYTAWQVLVSVRGEHSVFPTSRSSSPTTLLQHPQRLPRPVRPPDVLNGVSKTYSMTGWRIGYCGASERIITAMENIQSQSTSNPTAIAQVATQVAIDGDQSCIVPSRPAAFCEYLLDKARIAPVPGSAFGAEGYLRVSFATSMANLNKAAARLREAVSV